MTDTDTTQRIRDLLESHGYRDTGRPYSERAICGIRKVGGPSLESWGQALHVFLNDRSQTHAMLGRLFHECGSVLEITMAAPEDDPLGEGYVVSPKHGAWSKKYLIGEDIHDATVRLFLCVFDLPDPRKEVTA